MTPRRRRDPSLVQPRPMWAGTALAVVGLGTVGAGLMARNPVLTLLGCAVLVVGAFIAWRAGILRDVHATRAVDHEVADLRHGRPHRGTVAGHRVSNPAAQEKSRTVDQRRRELLEAGRRAPGPGRTRAAGALCLAASILILFAQWWLYPTGRTAQNNAQRALGVAIVLALCGLRMLVATRPRRLAAGLAILVGLELALFGPLARHQSVGVAWVETVLGAIVALAALPALTARSPGDAVPARTSAPER